MKGQTALNKYERIYKSQAETITEDRDRIVFKTGSSQIFQKVTDALNLWAEKNQEQEYNRCWLYI